MNKETFLRELEKRIAALPQSEREKTLAYYAEMIDDMVEDGAAEEEAVAKLGPVGTVAREVLLDAPLTTLMMAKAKPRHTMRAWEIVLLVLGSVVWLPLLLAFFAVVFSVYLCIWAVIISLFAAVLAVALSALAVPVGMVWVALRSAPLGIAVVAMGIGAALMLAGLAVAAFLLVGKLAKLLGKLSVSFIRWVKSLLIRKEESV